MTNNPAQLREAAASLIKAAEMLEHNNAIFKGKWKKGSKAWGGDFIERTVQEGIALLIPGEWVNGIDQNEDREAHEEAIAAFDEWIASEFPRATGYEIDVARTVWMAALAHVR